MKRSSTIKKHFSGRRPRPDKSRLPPRCPAPRRRSESPPTSPLLGFIDHDAISLWLPRLRPREPISPPGEPRPLGKRKASRSPTECWIYKEPRPRYRSRSTPTILADKKKLDDTIKRAERQLEELCRPAEDPEDILQSAAEGVLDLHPIDLQEDAEFLEFDDVNLNLMSVDHSSKSNSLRPADVSLPSDSSHYYDPFVDPTSPVVGYAQPVDVCNLNPVYDSVQPGNQPRSDLTVQRRQIQSKLAVQNLLSRFPDGRPRLDTPRDEHQDHQPEALLEDQGIDEAKLHTQSKETHAINEPDKTVNMSSDDQDHAGSGITQSGPSGSTCQGMPAGVLPVSHPQASDQNQVHNGNPQAPLGLMQGHMPFNPGAPNIINVADTASVTGLAQPPVPPFSQNTEASSALQTPFQFHQGLNLRTSTAQAPYLATAQQGQQQQQPGNQMFQPSFSTLSTSVNLGARPKAAAPFLHGSFQAPSTVFSSQNPSASGMPFNPQAGVSNAAVNMSSAQQQAATNAALVNWEAARQQLAAIAAAQQLGMGGNAIFPQGSTQQQQFHVNAVNMGLPSFGGSAPFLQNSLLQPQFHHTPLNSGPGQTQLSSLQASATPWQPPPQQQQFHTTLNNGGLNPVINPPCSVSGQLSNSDTDTSSVGASLLHQPSPEVIRDLSRKVRAAILIYSDNFQGLDPNDVSFSSLKGMVEEASKLRSDLQQSFLELDDYPGNLLNPNVIESGKTARQGLTQFIRQAEKLIQTREMHSTGNTSPHANMHQPSSRSDTVSAKARRVMDTKDSLIDELNAFELQLDEYLGFIPENEKTFKALHEQHLSLSRQVKSVRINASRMADLASEAALFDISSEIETLSLRVQKKERELDTHVQEYRGQYGSGATGTGSKTYEVKAPIFSGDLTKDKTDFYEFKRLWDDFCAARCLNPGDTLRTLKLTSLQGPAKYLCEHETDVDEIFVKLKASYGDPRVLLNAKLDELRKSGRCEGPPLKKRDWLVACKSKMIHLQKLALDHNIFGELYHSDIAKEVLGRLPTRTIEAVKEDIKETDQTDSNYAQTLYEITLKGVTEAIEDATLTMRLETSHKPSVDKPKKIDAPNKNLPQPRKTFTTDTTPVETSQEVPDDTKKPAVQKKKKKGVKLTVQANTNFDKVASVKCALCSNSHTHLFYCPSFLQEGVDDRYKPCGKVKSCFRCLRMDANLDVTNKAAWKKKHQPYCLTKFACVVDTCKDRVFGLQYHILMCRKHIDDNKQLEKKFTDACDKSQLTPSIKFFFTLPVMSTQPVESPASTVQRVYDGYEVKRDVAHSSIFLLQNVLINGQSLLAFYDSGCLTCCISEDAAIILNSVCVRPGPTPMHVAGGGLVELEGGDEQFVVTLVKKNTKAYMTGTKMKSVTSDFPAWPIHLAWERIQKEYKDTHPDGPELPAHPDVIGGRDIQLMIGIRYHALFPTLLSILPSGLGIYKSQIAAPNDEILVLGGPHEVWDTVAAASHVMSPVAFLTAEARAWYFQVCTLRSHPPILSQDMSEMPLDDAEHEITSMAMVPKTIPTEAKLTPISSECMCIDLSDTQHATVCSSTHCAKHDNSVTWFVPPEWGNHMVYTLRDSINRYLESELSGSDVQYRCFRCRNCSSCRQGELIESISLKEEKEQYSIEQSVSYDAILKKLTAKLPFIANPAEHLHPNRFIAEKILQSQLKLVSKSDQMRDDVIAAHEKLLSRGYVLPLHDLPDDVRAKVTDPAHPRYIIPWRTVAKPGSISTPVRMVFDASSATPSGQSLNCVLAKGVNKLLNIQHILTRFRTGKSGFISDIKMAYNNVALHEDFIRYQLYLWKPNLDPDAPTELMAVLTVIYGVRPSGNQLQAGLGLLGQHCIDNHPEHSEGALTVMNNTYVDDILAPADDHVHAESLAKSVEFTLGLGSMTVKAYTFAGQVPSPEVSSDGTSVGLVGLLWEPVEDLLRLDVKDLFFGKAKRGRLPDPVEGDVATALRPKFTRRNILSKVAGVYDPLGLLTPITCKFKLDLHSLCELKADWDQLLPEEYLLEWVKNLDTIQHLREIPFRRAVIPEDAASTNIQLLVSCDASQFLALAAVHARVKLRSGGYSSQLLNARSKLVRMNTIPKGELRAATMAAALGHVAKTNIGHKHTGTIHVTDSTVALYWISQDSRPLETIVRNGVVEIRRLTDVTTWYHIESALNPADLGTRPAAIEQVGIDSAWQTGFPWMKLDVKDMPLRTADEITLDSESKRLASEAARNPSPCGVVLPNLKSKVADRYDSSNYVIDPNCFGWQRTLRAMAYVMKFVKINAPTWRPIYEDDSSPAMQSYSWEELESLAANYYFYKGTAEVHKFSNSKDYDTCSVLKNGIIYYTGRILEGQAIEDPTSTFHDVEKLHFVRPILDRFSPVAYSVMLSCHSDTLKHRSSPATLRESRSVAYILKGRDLSNEITDNCRPCHRFRARLVEAEMSKLHQSRLTIAPAFYFVQCDLFGPLKMVCEHHSRSTLKGYGVVFKDPASSCVAAFAMQSYSTPSFLQAFTRFAVRYGVPTKVVIDQGSQLVSAFESMDLCVRDIEQSLQVNYNVKIEYSTAPVGGHNFNGMAERSIQEIKGLLSKTFGGLRTDLLTLETNLAWVCNEINSLPICLGSKTEGLGSLDILTPNRLLLGRNNRRALGGYAKIDQPGRMLDQQDQTYRAWWELWRTERLADYIPQPAKWKKSNDQLCVGDIVAFPRKTDDQHFGSPVYRLGRIIELHPSTDGICRSADIEYKNSTESTFRQTKRAVRTLAKVHREGELDVIQTLNEAVKEVEIAYNQFSEADPPCTPTDSTLVLQSTKHRLHPKEEICNFTCPAYAWFEDLWE